MAKYKNFDCTLWDDGTIILSERPNLKKWQFKKKNLSIEDIMGSKFRGTLEELAANYKKELFQEG